MEKPFVVGTANHFTVVEFQMPSMMNPADLERIGAAIHALVDERATGKLVLDFTRVEYISSQAIGMVVGLNKKVSAMAGGKLVMCGVGPQIREVLKITRLDRLLKVAKDQQEAVK